MGPHPRRPPVIGLLALVAVAAAVLGSLPARVSADSGGPDVYGYTWVDSKFPNPGVTYSWIDGVGGGTDLLLTDDGCSQNRIAFGFAFRFYGIIYSDGYVCANGFVAFNTPARAYKMERRTEGHAEAGSNRRGCPGPEFAVFFPLRQLRTAAPCRSERRLPGRLARATASVEGDDGEARW